MTDKKQTDLALVDEKYLAERANLGMEEVEADDIPTPTLLLTQDISKVVDAEGKKIPAGKFYYSGTGQVFDEVDVTFLIITKKETPDFQTKQPTPTHVYLGVMHPDLTPFLMFFKNTGLFSSKEFLGKVRAMKSPMYAVNVKLIAEQTSFEKNTWWKIRFQIIGTKENMSELVILEDLIHQYQPQLETDIDKTVEANEKRVASDLPFGN